MFRIERLQAVDGIASDIATLHGPIMPDPGTETRAIARISGLLLGSPQVRSMRKDDSIMADDEQCPAFLAALLRCEDAAWSTVWQLPEVAEAVLLRDRSRPIAGSAA